MEYAILFAILYPIIAVIFAVAVVLYASFIGGVEFGVLGPFLLKSAALIAVVTLVMFIPYGGFLTLAVWWGGFVLLFGMEFWEAKVIVAIIWGLTFVTRMALLAVLQ